MVEVVEIVNGFEIAEPAEAIQPDGVIQYYCYVRKNNNIVYYGSHWYEYNEALQACRDWIRKVVE